MENEEVGNLEAEILIERIKSLEDTLESQNITIEVTNERWIEQVNKNMQLEIQLRRLKTKHKL